jgi:formimidoylglutamate deiminase
MERVFARKALLATGWADDVSLPVVDGRLGNVECNVAARPGDVIAGIVIPGLTNAHSHAFQRALAGRTEQRAPAGEDNFWSWRERMYRLAGRLDAAALAAIAAQVYAEMLVSGYTSVAEFHYLHNGPDGDDAMFDALRDAALRSGMRMTYVPVLYERAGFDHSQPQGEQKRFATDLDKFLAHHARVRDRRSERIEVAIGAHSLRAVSDAALGEIAAVAAQAELPMHLHIAEQRREVDECEAAYGSRPVRWLLDHFDVDRHWCLVHATHMDDDETQRLARSGAVVCLCPSTEANLGDGLFPLHDFLNAGGSIAIGSDSHVSINPFEELRWLEYGQRLASLSRNIVSLQQAHVGSELYSRALEGGAQATLTRPAGLQHGAFADLVVLHDDDPMLVGHGDASLLDALVFSGYRLPIERVMVHGEWCVVDGDHVDQARTCRDFAATLKRIGVAT